ncbi:DUF459 domain-containing protein [Enterobacter ludwigii]|uniref:SGNH/GDSL hydrolase family protein n=1 Tax=Enterobacter ludwigii TaxID=299767 RepID=UPI001E2926EC|nr:SGNH family hydrolase [Enterobacter ludwigii]MCE1608877.1 DUF459 domain-containing protein [Enterobacter ludwigii]MCE1622173.1 DUF459 domain-containing protein [Enterobacter ludwigii]
MQVSDYRKILSRTLKVIIVVGVTFISVCWLYQQNLSQYWTLHFHHDAPWETVTADYWREGAIIMNAATLSEQTFISALQNEHQGVNNSQKDVSVSEDDLSVVPEVQAAGDTLPLPVFSQEPSGLLQLSKRISEIRDPSNQSDTLPGEPEAALPDSGGEALTEGPLYERGEDKTDKAILDSSRTVLLIGDSMMEGVAPRVLKILREKHHVTGIDLSRRSTGLAYPGFYNWPATTAETLRQTPSVGLLVVFLGPNDPWDMPAGKGKPFLKFESDDWERVYRERIDQILELTKAHQIPVIWVMPPSMRKLKLSHGMKYLNTLYASEVQKYGGLLVEVNSVFDYGPDNYAPDILIRGKMTRIRADDGIHYTPAGESLIAQAIVSRIRVEQQEGLSTDER